MCSPLSFYPVCVLLLTGRSGAFARSFRHLLTPNRTLGNPTAPLFYTTISIRCFWPRKREIGFLKNFQPDPPQQQQYFRRRNGENAPEEKVRSKVLFFFFSIFYELLLLFCTIPTRWKGGAMK